LDFYVFCPQLNRDFLRYILRNCNAGFFYQFWFSFFGWLFSETAPCISYTWRCFFWF